MAPQSLDEAKNGTNKMTQNLYVESVFSAEMRVRNFV